MATNTGGNATGGDITQTAGTLLNVGTGDNQPHNACDRGGQHRLQRATPIFDHSRHDLCERGYKRCIHHGE